MLHKTRETEDSIILETKGIEIHISKELAEQLNLDEAIKDLSRTCIRVKNRYPKVVEKK